MYYYVENVLKHKPQGHAYIQHLRCYGKHRHVVQIEKWTCDVDREVTVVNNEIITIKDRKHKQVEPIGKPDKASHAYYNPACEIVLF